MPQVLSKIEPLHPPIVAPQTAVMRGMTPDGHQLFYEEIPRTMGVPRLVPGSETTTTCKDCGGTGKQADIPDWDCYRCDGKGEHETGEQEFKKDPAGNRVYPLNKHKRYTQRRLYFIESQGNGNASKTDWQPPSAAEMAAADRAARVAAMKDALAETLVDEGLSPQELVARLRGAPAAQTVGPAGPVAPGEGPVVEHEAPVVTEEVVEPDKAEGPKELELTQAAAPSAPDPGKTYPHHTGGGYYELSNGSRARGKKAAQLAEKAIQDARADMEGVDSF